MAFFAVFMITALQLRGTDGSFCAPLCLRTNEYSGWLHRRRSVLVSFGTVFHEEHDGKVRRITNEKYDLRQNHLSGQDSLKGLLILAMFCCASLFLSHCFFWAATFVLCFDMTVIL